MQLGDDQGGLWEGDKVVERSSASVYCAIDRRLGFWFAIRVMPIGAFCLHSSVY